MKVTPCLPHGVQQGAVILDPQQFVGHGHVVRDRFLPVVKKCVWSPDLTGHQVVQTQNIHRSLKLQPFILPALPKEDIDGVLLQKDETTAHFRHILRFCRMFSVAKGSDGVLFVIIEHTIPSYSD